MPYDSANAQITRSLDAPNVTGVASTSVRKFYMFQKTRVKRVHLLINVAGTNDAAGFDILNGTSSIGEIVCGTATAGSTATSAALNSDVAAGSYLDIKGKATSATLAVSIAVEATAPDA